MDNEVMMVKLKFNAAQHIVKYQECGEFKLFEVNEPFEIGYELAGI